MKDKNTVLDLILSSKEEYNRQVFKEIFPNIKAIIVDFKEEDAACLNDEGCPEDSWTNWAHDMFCEPGEII